MLVTRHGTTVSPSSPWTHHTNRNALSTALLAQLRDAVNEAAADESLVAILLTSSQPVFCAVLTSRRLPAST